MKVTGIIAGAVVAVLFLMFIELPLLADLTNDRESVSWAMNIGIFSGAALAGLLLDNVYAPKFILLERFAEHKAGTRIGCVLGGLLGLPLAFILGVMFGGTLGGGVGSIIWEPLIPYGVGLGIMAVILIFVTITSLLGSIIGSFVDGSGRG